MLQKRSVVVMLFSLLLISLLSYGIYSSLTRAGTEEIFLSTTTSVENTGLLDYLIEEYQQQAEYTVRYTAVGSGNAIQLARDGIVDAVLTHAPDLELELIEDGYSRERHLLWYNYFVLLGPAADPAGISSVDNITQAFAAIHQAGQQGQATFYSRGDQSGTHLKELQIWEAVGLSIDPTKSWYIETGNGMAATLVTADHDTEGYILADLATFVTMQNSETSIDKKVLYEGQDSLLYNPYSYMVINSQATGTDLNTVGARDFLQFLNQPSTQNMIQDYQIGQVALFTPVQNE